jgi:prepilin-type N-terminal cleavage/methylation domain-containing protein
MPELLPAFSPAHHRSGLSARASAKAGYTLIEMSVVLAIASAITVASISMGVSMIESARRGQTSQKLNTIEDALMSYRLAYNRMPCPASPTLPTTDSNYGNEADNASGTCTGGVPAAPWKDNTNNVVEGAVPVNQLGLPADFMYDGWGRKFVYAVNYNVTAANAMSGQAISERCGITVSKTTGGGSRSKGAIYALVSYGSDGHGGYLRTTARYSSGSTNTDALTNCHCNGSAVETSYAATYVLHDRTENSASSTDTFDSFVRFKERWQLASSDDMFLNGSPVCTPGFRVDGASAGITSGTAAAVGDINGDGIADLIIGAPNASPGGHAAAGAIYVVFGTTTGYSSPLTLSGLSPTGIPSGFEIDGTVASEKAGQSLAVGDVNGDGIKDIIIGAPFASPATGANAGSVFVVFGKQTWSYSTYTLDNTALTGLIDGTNGAEYDGPAAGYHAGNRLATGNINGDLSASNHSIDDIIIGAPNAAPGGNANAGSAYVVFGKSSGWPVTQTLNAAFLNGTNGLEFDGSAVGLSVGSSVAAGDFKGHGNGILDVIMSAPLASPGGNANAGLIYVVFGKGAGWASPQTLNAGFLNGANGFELDGAAASDSVDSVATGDVDGDGKADLVIGAYSAGGGAGKTYVVFGGSTMKNATMWSTCPCTLASAGTVINGTNGAEFDGVGAYAGYSLATGDVNGDGKADIIIGASWAPGWNQNGAAYVVFGRSAGSWNVAPQTLNAAFLNGTNGIELDGVTALDQAGTSVAVGDLTGDGIADIVIGAPNATAPSGGNATAGSTYIYFGKSARWPTSAYGLGNLCTGSGC